MTTIHPIRRTKQLTEDISEVLFSRNNLIYKPGDKVKLHYKGEEKAYYIASGIQEPWVRILCNDKLDIKMGDSVRVLGIEPGVSNLINANEEKGTAVYIGVNDGIAPGLSYLSTFPQDKFRAIIYKYNKEGINIEWLEHYHNCIHGADMPQLLDSIPLNSEEYNSDYYIYGQGDTMIKDYLLNHGIYECNIFIN